MNVLSTKRAYTSPSFALGSRRLRSICADYALSFPTIRTQSQRRHALQSNVATGQTTWGVKPLQYGNASYNGLKPHEM